MIIFDCLVLHYSTFQLFIGNNLCSPLHKEVLWIKICFDSNGSLLHIFFSIKFLTASLEGSAKSVFANKHTKDYY